MRHLLLLLACVLSVGCVGSYDEAKFAGQKDRGLIGAKPTPSPYCQSLDSARDVSGAFAKGLALVAAGFAVSVAALKDEKAQAYAGIGAGAGTGIAGGIFWYSEAKGKTWARDCSQ